MCCFMSNDIQSIINKKYKRQNNMIKYVTEHKIIIFMPS